DYRYELGSGGLVPEIDQQLQGARAGDILKFNAAVPGQDEDVTFQILVKETKEKILPEVTDERASEASEFDTVDELKEDLRRRIGEVKRVQTQLALRDAVLQELVNLVADDPPEALVGVELERRIHDLGHRLEHQGANLAQYLEVTGQDQDQLLAGLRGASIEAVKADLALRAVADAEGIEATDEDVDAEIAR